MNTRRTGLVGVLVENLNNPHTTALLEELGREFSRHSIQMVLGTADRLENGRTLLGKFSNGMVDGILNTLPELDENEAQKLAGGVPLITYRRHRDAPLIIDFAAGTRTALSYLNELGHRNIAIIPSDSRAPAWASRSVFCRLPRAARSVGYSGSGFSGPGRHHSGRLRNRRCLVQ